MSRSRRVDLALGFVMVKTPAHVVVDEKIGPSAPLRSAGLIGSTKRTDTVDLEYSWSAAASTSALVNHFRPDWKPEHPPALDETRAGPAACLVLIGEKLGGELLRPPSSCHVNHDVP